MIRQTLVVICLALQAACIGQTTIGYYDTAKASKIEMLMRSDTSVEVSVCLGNGKAEYMSNIVGITLSNDSTIILFEKEKLRTSSNCCSSIFSIWEQDLPMLKQFQIKSIGVNINDAFQFMFFNEHITRPSFFINYYNGKKEKKAKSKAPKN